MTPVAEAILQYIRIHGRVHKQERRQIRGSNSVLLRHAEGKVDKQLAWEVQVAKSYEWHRHGADRQIAAFRDEVQALSQPRQDNTYGIIYFESMMK